MTENTLKFYYKKDRIVLMLVGLIAIISLATFIWPFLNEPHLVIRRGIIIIIWILATYSGIIMISSLFSHKPAIVIDVKGFEVSRLLGGIGWLDWSNINSIILRNSKIKVVLNDAYLVRNKYLFIDHIFLNIWQNTIHIRKTYLIDIQISELHLKIKKYYHRYCLSNGSSKNHYNEKKLCKENFSKEKGIIYGYSTLGYDFSPLLIAGENMFKYQDRFYRFDDIDSIEHKGTNIVSFPYSLPSAKIILKDGTKIKIIGNLVRKDRSKEIDILSEGTEAFYELLDYLGNKR